MTAQIDSFLEIDNLHVGYSGCDVVRGVSLSLRRGELWGILGPNGVGKSTLLRACLQLLPVTNGEVRFLGKNVRDWARRDMAKEVAWVPQQVSPSESFTALELVLMGRHPHHGSWGLSTENDVNRATQALEKMGVARLANVSCHHMSGGELRLVAIARAWVQSPRLMLLDEPTAFLDLQHQVTTLRALREFVDEGGAAMAVLHDVNLAAAYCDKVLLLKDGRAIACGDSRDVMTPENLSEIYGLDMGRAEFHGRGLFAPRKV